jgi:putative membrane protein
VNWLLGALATGYLAGVHASRRPWPLWRTACWYTGVACALIGTRTPHDLTGHMIGHLLTGMAAPLLLVLARPVTLALGSLPVTWARRLSHLLRSWPARILTHPVTAAVLSAGGLWLVFLTGLHHTHPAWVNAHFLLAGYLFTAAIAGADPVPHRPAWATRAAALIAAMAAHGILAKYLYGHLPGAEQGAQLMYYAGDALHVVLIVLLCTGAAGLPSPDRRGGPDGPGPGRRASRRAGGPATGPGRRRPAGPSADAAPAADPA